MRPCCGPPALKGSFRETPSYRTEWGDLAKQGLQGRRAALSAALRRSSAALFDGRRFWANSGERLDFEGTVGAVADVTPGPGC